MEAGPEFSGGSGRGGSTNTAKDDPTSKSWQPRTCRICFETVLPTFRTAPDNIFGSHPSVTYESEDGRLLRPCLCKGSSKYVHENCLQAWRHSDRSLEAPRFWQCPTCRFRYRLERMRWAQWINSTGKLAAAGIKQIKQTTYILIKRIVVQILLTLLVIFTTVFLLGFCAEPLLNFYLDPFDSFTSWLPWPTAPKVASSHRDGQSQSWLDHLLKGLATLGVLGCVKACGALPWRIWRSRFSTGRAGRAMPSGRQRIEDVGILVLVVGVTIFLIVSKRDLDFRPLKHAHEARPYGKQYGSGVDAA